MAKKVVYPEDFYKLRDTYPALKSEPTVWKKVSQTFLMLGYDKAKAEAEMFLSKYPKLLIRNYVALKHRSIRREYLRFQIKTEGLITANLKSMSDKIETMLNNNADDSGKIPMFKMNYVLDKVKKYNTDAFAQVLYLLNDAIKQSIRYGIDTTAMSTQAGIDKAREMEKVLESEHYGNRKNPLVDLVEARASGVTQIKFQSIFDKVKARQMEKGLFGNRKQGKHQEGGGVNLSQRVWDLRNANLVRMRNRVAGGIASGEPSQKIARDIRNATWREEQGDNAPSGPGIYRSAQANALRLARTETNNAYVDAELEYSRDEGLMKMWNLSPGHTCCFFSETMVRTLQGDRPIENIKVGTVVLTHTGNFREVTKTYKRKIAKGSMVLLRFVSERGFVHELYCTLNHPFLINKEWVEAKDLKIGERGISAHGGGADLVQKKIIKVKNKYVYNLTVDDDNSYFANEIAVHNCDGCDDLAGQIMTPDEVADEYPVHPNESCPVLGTKIRTERGWEKIENLKVGDTVIGHSGRVNRISRTFRRFVKEPIIELCIGPASLRLTNEHPVLTERGFINAKDIKQGDKICVSEGIVREPNIKNFPPFFKKCNFFLVILKNLFRAFVPTSTINFNSNFQRRNCNIYIPLGKSEKRDAIKSSRFNKIIYNFFTLGLFPRFLNTSCSCFHPLQRAFFSKELCSAFIRRLFHKFRASIFPTQFYSFSHTTAGKTEGSEFFCKIPSRNPQINGKLFKGNKFIPMAFMGKGNVEIKSVIGMFLRHSSLLYQMKPVTATKIIDYEGEVFNLSVENDETYIAEGIIVHNCFITTVVPGYE